MLGRYLLGCLASAEVDEGFAPRLRDAQLQPRDCGLLLCLWLEQRWQGPCPYSGLCQGADREVSPRNRVEMETVSFLLHWYCYLAPGGHCDLWLSLPLFLRFHTDYQADWLRERCLQAWPPGGSLLLTWDVCVGKYHLQWVNLLLFQVKVGIHLRIHNIPLWQLMENVLYPPLAEVLFQTQTFGKDEVISVMNMEQKDLISPK